MAIAVPSRGKRKLAPVLRRVMFKLALASTAPRLLAVLSRGSKSYQNQIFRCFYSVRVLSFLWINEEPALDSTFVQSNCNCFFPPFSTGHCNSCNVYNAMPGVVRAERVLQSLTQATAPVSTCPPLPITGWKRTFYHHSSHVSLSKPC